MGLGVVYVDTDRTLAVERTMHDIKRALSYAQCCICAENESSPSRARRRMQGRIIRIGLAISSLAPCYGVKPRASGISVDINRSFVVAIAIKAKYTGFNLRV